MTKNKKPLTLQEVSEASKKRVAFIAKEFTDGFELIKNYPRSVTFFGSARTKTNDQYYKEATNLAKRIVEELHYSVVTGGGPGIMGAANKGAFKAGGNSVGLAIELPHEQNSNDYLTDSVYFHYFFTRKVCLSFSAEAYVFFPGGFGTLDEFTEILTLQQTGKIEKAPIILVGKRYWHKLEHFFKDEILKNNMINEEDLSIYTITDDEDEIINIIKNAPIRIGLEFDGGKKAHAIEEDEDITEGPLSELSKKHCLPCEGNVAPLKDGPLKSFLNQVTNWTLEDEKQIEKDFHFKDFKEAVSFIDKVAVISEKEGHHPDITLFDYNNVRIKIQTHSIDGLSENDFILASKIDEILK